MITRAGPSVSVKRKDGDLDWWRRPRQVSIVVDNESWILPHATTLVQTILNHGDQCSLLRNYDDIPAQGIAFFLGCVNIAPARILSRSHRNLVVHASDLPKGRGFSPLSWLILSGAHRIPVCLLEAHDEPDAGPVIYKEWINYGGHELNDELRVELGRIHVELCSRFLNETSPPTGEPQVGSPTKFRRRTPQDSRLDPDKTIASQFNLLRIVDNNRYPAFFEIRGHRYVLKIEKADAEGGAS